MRRALAAGALALLLAGCGSTVDAPASVPGASPASSTAAATAEAVVPQATGIFIPKIGARSSLEPIGLNADGTMGVPPVSQPGQAAYYDDGPMPGAPGPALIVGHVNGGGRDGVFADLHTLRAGDDIEIQRVEAATAVFRVSKVEKVSKSAFPWDRVLAETTGPELRLVTCGGSFNPAARSYVDNWIIYATLIT